jgi:NTP pyrophosphatase (non-canonical NTP hydrolase)
MDLDEYQREAAATSQLKEGSAYDALAPMLGLASETGSILNVYKKYMRDKIDLPSHKQFLKEELGDLLWYLAAVARTFKLSLNEIATDNLRQTQDNYGDQSTPLDLTALPDYDDGYPDHERFPRKLLIGFSESADRKRASMTVVDAKPYEFAGGLRTDSKGRHLGFELNKPFGDELTDNSRRADGYRYHDAIHLGFMAVLGWSPSIRSLLRLKRKSNQQTDEVEDGARAIFADEGLAAILAKLSLDRRSFEDESCVDSETIGFTKKIVAGLEVDTAPGRLWKRAISQGFNAMRSLDSNEGGFLIADLDERTLTFSRTPADLA